jgi:hypothetical protein
VAAKPLADDLRGCALDRSIEPGSVRSGHRPGSLASSVADCDVPSRVRAALDRTAIRDGSHYQSTGAERNRGHDRRRRRQQVRPSKPIVPGVASWCADADTKADVVAQLTPFLGQCSDSDTHFQRHLDSLERRAIDGNGIIEDHHHPVARVSFRGSVVPDNDLADGGMVHAAEPSRLPSPSFQRSRSMKVLGITSPRPATANLRLPTLGVVDFCSRSRIAKKLNLQPRRRNARTPHQLHRFEPDGCWDSRVMCDECASRSASKLPRPPRCLGCAQPMKLVRRTMRFGGLRDLYTFECRQCGEWHTEEGSK